jgi:hypothetical protein
MLLLGFLFLWIGRSYGGHKKVNRETQRTITDVGILELIEGQPDGLMTAAQLGQATGLSKVDALRRLMMLQVWGVLRYFSSNRAVPYFSLLQPLDRRPPPELSPEPFLTVDDIVRLFRYHDFRMTAQDLLTSTQLPANILQREMQYFQREKVVRQLSQHVVAGQQAHKIYVLQEPYRSDPESFLDQGGRMDLQLKEMLKKEDLI